MPFLGSKYAKIAFAADHAGGAYSALPDLLSALRGPTSMGGERREGGGEGREGKVAPPFSNSWIRH